MQCICRPPSTCWFPLSVGSDHDDRGPVFERGPPLSEIQNSSIFSLDDVSDDEMNQLIDGTITDFDEGDLVTGTVVKIEHDEVLLDIGYKSEGVIPARELSIRKDVDPSEIVGIGDQIEALVLQKEDKEGGGNSTFANIDIKDCTPLSLGVETVGGVMSVMIPKNNKM